MIQGDFGDVEGAESIGFSHGEFGFVVEALDDAAGELFSGSEIIEDEFAVGAQGFGDLLHGLDAGAHDLPAPFVEELGGPGGRVVIPELLEVFLKQVGADGLEIVAQQLAQAQALGAVRFSLRLRTHQRVFLKTGW